MNQRKIFWTLLLIINVITLSGLSLLFSADKDESLHQKEQSRLIGMSYMTMNNDFYRMVLQEISYEIEARGDQILLRDPALSTARQSEQIEEFISKEVDALIVTPVDWKQIEPVIREAKSQGIIIIAVDTDLYDGSLADATITSDNYAAGYMMGEYFLQKNTASRLVLMGHQATRSGQDRLRGFRDAISQEEGIEVLETLECEGQTEIAMPEMLSFIEKGIPFDAVFCLNDQAALGAIAALDQEGLLETTEVYGIDASPDAKGLIYEGMMAATVAQFPTEIGKESARALYRLLEGESVESTIRTRVELVTPENVTKYGIERWQ